MLLKPHPNNGAPLSLPLPQKLGTSSGSVFHVPALELGSGTYLSLIGFFFTIY